MKTILLSWKLFLKKPFSNAVLAIELALTLLIVVIVSNAYQYSQSSIRAIENSQSRMLYCSDPNFADPDSNPEKEEKTFEQTLRNLHERFPYVKGFSKIYESAILFERKHFDKEEATPLSDSVDVMVYDETTFSNIRLPLSSGTWPGVQLVDGKIPCVLGGVSGKHYKVGDTISGYTLGKNNSSKLAKSPDFIVQGILAVPQQSLKVGDGCGTNITPASSFFTDMTNRSLFLIAPGNLFNGGATEESSFYGTFVFLGRYCTQAQINKVRNALSRGYTQLDTEIVAAEQAENGKTFQTMMPFLIMIFLVVFLGLISVCMLTTIKNMQTFKVYYLEGCPRKKILLLMFWYVLFYFIIAVMLFAVFFICLRKAVNGVLTLAAYFILQPSGFIWIGLVCAVVMTCSLLIPFILIRKNDLASLLRKD